MAQIFIRLTQRNFKYDFDDVREIFCLRYGIFSLRFIRIISAEFGEFKAFSNQIVYFYTYFKLIVLYVI